MGFGSSSRGLSSVFSRVDSFFNPFDCGTGPPFLDLMALSGSSPLLHQREFLWFPTNSGHKAD